MPKLPTPVPVRGLRLADRDNASFTLRAPRFMVHARALAPDLFRLRIGRGRELPESHSWAAVSEEGTAPDVRVVAGRSRIQLRSSVGTLNFTLGSGAWSIEDTHGLTVFSAGPNATAFAGAQARLTLDLQEGESLFGLGECTGAFNRRGSIRDFWNIDVLGHAPAIHPALRQLYVSIPFAFSLRNGRAAGLFWDNPARQNWDLGQTVLDRWQMTAESGEMDLYLFLGPRVAEIASSYANLTGHMPLPPRWGLGYQQSRYSYETADRVREIAREFRQRRLPCDVLHLDIHHLDGYRVFTFGRKFPQPASLIRELAGQGFLHRFQKLHSFLKPCLMHRWRHPLQA